MRAFGLRDVSPGLRLILVGLAIVVFGVGTVRAVAAEAPEFVSWPVLCTDHLYPNVGDVIKTLGPPVAAGPFGLVFRAQGNWADGILDSRDTFSVAIPIAASDLPARTGGEKRERNDG